MAAGSWRQPEPAAQRVPSTPPWYGSYRLGATEIINAALVDNAYELVNPVVEITL